MFKNRGWAFYDKMKLVMPLKEKGSNIFCVIGLQVQGASSSSASKQKSLVTLGSENGTRMHNLCYGIN